MDAYLIELHYQSSILVVYLSSPSVFSTLCWKRVHYFVFYFLLQNTTRTVLFLIESHPAKVCPLCYLSSSYYLSSPSSKVCWTHILKHLKTITTELQYFAWSTLNQKWCNKPLSVVDLSSCTHFIVYYCLSLFQWQ